MTLAICLIMLFVDVLLALNAGEANILNQKMDTAWMAQDIALNSAEAGLAAVEAKINGQSVDLSQIKGQLSNNISNETIDQCQQHLFTIVSNAVYQNAQVKLTAQYLQAHQPPIENCAANQPSHQLWWRQVDG
jgi:Tfp pilus assembly protein PilX